MTPREARRVMGLPNTLLGSVSDPQPAPSKWHPGGSHLHLLGAAAARPQLRYAGNLPVKGGRGISESGRGAA